MAKLLLNGSSNMANKQRFDATIEPNLLTSQFPWF